ncbi:MAG: response regulator [Alphaproteobacteria bacterium]|nr:response regulator [Alphaproteobacteria bacterium]
MHILLVEDHPDNREMLARRLERKGYTVSFAVDGAEAIDRRFALDPDVILMDISMPVMSGLEATRHIRARETDKRTPIIALTAHAMESARVECIEAGCDAFATKPVDFPALLVLLATYGGAQAA